MNNAIASIKEHARPFSNKTDFLPLVREASKAQLVLLGEASHGTSEFYTIRAELTKELITNYGFSFVAVEGDWPSCYELNRYVKGKAPEYLTAEDALKTFNRWPTWMWANEEVVDLIEWMRDYNTKVRPDTDKQIGFYGIDVYSLWESMEAIIQYLKQTGSPDVDIAKKAFECFEPYHRKPEEYAISSAFYGQDCLQDISSLFHTLTNKKQYENNDLEGTLNMQVNALVARNAEFYYHTMITNDNESWNIRDRHMVEALDYIKDYYGKGTRGIVWEHNTHIGDARATDMADEDMVNVGQLARENYGTDNVYSVGFSTYKGSVIAASKWGEPLQEMKVPEAMVGSWEDLLHQSGAFNKYLLFSKENHHLFNRTIGHRAIGVLYHPDVEHLGNYVPSRISDRYDAFIHIEETSALKPLNI